MVGYSNFERFWEITLDMLEGIKYTSLLFLILQPKMAEILHVQSLTPS